jgi:tellurite resistance protein
MAFREALSEPAAYAVAAWQRFSDTIPNDLLRAIISAFALIAISDGDLAEDEKDRFARLLQKQSIPLAGVAPKEVEHAFYDVIDALLSDPDNSRRHALAQISNIAGDGKSDTDGKIVLAIAQIAMNADEQLRSAESKAFADIKQALHQF